MNKTEIENRITKAEQELAEAKKLLSTHYDKPLVDEWGRYLTAPEDGARYFPNPCSFVDGFKWVGDEADRRWLESGRAFTTKKAALAAAERDEIEQELRVLSAKAWRDAGEVCDWTAKQDKFCIEGYENTVAIGQYYYTHSKSPFPTRESAQAAIQAIGEDRLKKLFVPEGSW